MPEPVLNGEESRKLVAQLQGSDEGYAQAREVAPLLGARMLSVDRAALAFWTPDLAELSRQDDTEVLLELTELPADLDAGSPPADAKATRTTLQPLVAGNFLLAVVDGVRPGNKETLGTMYRLRYRSGGGPWRMQADPLAISVPFGAFAPAEIYDTPAMLAGRADTSHYQRDLFVQDDDGIPRMGPPATMVEIHPATATESGTLAGLAARFREISDRISHGEALSASDLAFCGYDAIQLMPIEPLVEPSGGGGFWREQDDGTGAVRLGLRRPSPINWGYDVITAASPSINPGVLAHGRPDELLDLMDALHSFAGGAIRLVLDVVFGHADNVAMELLDSAFFAGANMYGQNLRYTNPMVRALLLEMLSRKAAFGVDGIRIDGAQDFKNYNPERNEMVHDDDFLSDINRLQVVVGEVKYRPWMIFEDGRPWPRDDWELASSYREVTVKHPNVVQWGPLTFAHNTPALFTFWIGKWWRIREILEVGNRWITGNSNHDTLRRGEQLAPEARINTYLGENLPNVFRNAYDNPAARLLECFLPGIPMDFLNASHHAPWAFIRNTERVWALKVMGEEQYFLRWCVRPGEFAEEASFTRLKRLGFTELAGLQRFVSALARAIEMTSYHPDAIGRLLARVEPALPGPGPLGPGELQTITEAWTADIHDFLRLDRWAESINSNPEVSERRRFAHAVLAFRRQKRWLMERLGTHDSFDYLHPTGGAVVMHGFRRAPDGSMGLFFLGNMEGAPAEVSPRALGGAARWTPIFVTPGLVVPSAPAQDVAGAQADAREPGPDGAERAQGLPEQMTLANSQAVLWQREAET